VEGKDTGFFKERFRVNEKQAEDIELTSDEEALLGKYLWFYRNLANGIRQPTTPEQRHFVQVSMERVAPESPHEIAYMKYLRIREQREAETARNPELDGPTDGWFTREDWKKSRGRQKSDGRRD
jgi:uncharacterized protein YifE (UPF0438 family)